MKKLRHAAIRLMAQQKPAKSVRIAHRMAWLIEERGYKVMETLKYFPNAKCKQGLRAHYKQYQLKRKFVEQGMRDFVPRCRGFYEGLTEANHRRNDNFITRATKARSAGERK